VLSIGLVASGHAAVEYFVRQTAGCDADYYTRTGQATVRWVGAGANALRLTGDLTPDGELVLRGLLDGYGPDGVRLVPAVLRGNPRARLPVAPLVAAVGDAAAEAGLPIALLLDDHRLTKQFTSMAKGLTGGEVVRARGVRVDVAVAIAEAAGLNVQSVYEPDSPDGHDLVAEALNHVGERIDIRRAGLDLTFSAPKSVSVLMAFATPHDADQVRAAHAAAVDDAMAWLERTTAFVARGHHGDGQRAERLSSDGFIGVAFEHVSSRAGDPQLHTHVVIANLLRGIDGRWSAADSKALHRHGKTAGYLYQAVLRAELTKRLGVGWGEVGKGTAEIAGIPRSLRSVFSKRAEQIASTLRTSGTAGAKAAQRACLSTRPSKDQAVTVQDLRDRWTAEAVSTGHDPDRIVAEALGQEHPVSRVDVIDISDHLLGPEGLTRQATTFDRNDLLQAIAAALPVGTEVDVAGIEALANAVLRDPRVVHTSPTDGTGEAHEWSPRWTTTELLAIEQHALDLAESLRSRPVDAAPRGLVEWAIGQRNLGGDQAAMVRALTTAPQLLHVVVGPAGSGKTAALAAAATVWQLNGRKIMGASLSALASRQLARGADIPAITVARLLSRLDASARSGAGPLTEQWVLVIDEAGMVGTRDLARLLGHAEAAGASIVLVGDPAQLPEIEAGGLFAALASDASAELHDNHRQSEAWEQQALTRLRDGHVDRALDAYLAHDRVHIGTDAESLRNRVVADYVRAAGESDHPDSVAILAATRHQVRTYNDAVRELLDGEGLLSGPELTIPTDDGDLRLRAGDRVLITRNDYDRDLLNGDRAVVAHVSAETGSLTLATPDGTIHDLPHSWLDDGRLDHAYAITCHKAQGQTLDETLVAGSAALTCETAYVALSRGRSTNHLYLAPEAGRDDPAQEWLTDTVLTDVSRRLRTSRRHVMAVDQVGPSRAIGIGDSAPSREAVGL
jgi:conjugative relaxase-like TrwC/TraI family protein